MAALRIALALSLIAAAACGGKGKKTSDGPDTVGTGSPDAGVAGTPEAGSATPAAGELTAEECDRFIDHVVRVAAAAKAADDPEGYYESEEVIAKAREQMAAQLGDECLRVLPRSAYECSLEANDYASVKACLSGDR